MKDLGKVEAGKLELEDQPFRLEDIIADARLFSHSATKKGLLWAEDIAFTFMGQVMGDMPRLRQVLSNLISNAIKVRFPFHPHPRPAAVDRRCLGSSRAPGASRFGSSKNQSPPTRSTYALRSRIRGVVSNRRRSVGSSSRSSELRAEFAASRVY